MLKEDDLTKMQLLGMINNLTKIVEGLVKRVDELEGRQGPTKWVGASVFDDADLSAEGMETDKIEAAYREEFNKRVINNQEDENGRNQTTP